MQQAAPGQGVRVLVALVVWVSWYHPPFDVQDNTGTRLTWAKRAKDEVILRGLCRFCEDLGRSPHADAMGSAFAVGKTRCYDTCTETRFYPFMRLQISENGR